MQTCIGRSALAASFLSIFLLPVIVFAANPTCTLKASAYSITLGNTVNLTWTSTNAISGTITDLDSVALSGTQGVIPTGNGKTYVAVFTSSSGTTATCSVRVTTNGSGTGGIYTPSTYDSTTNTFTPGTYTCTGIFTPGTYNPNTKAYVPSTYTPPK
ncbi:MAG: hypothetical protein Q7S26_04395, partial [bacterium]|nr:hypothetical protein [bacterium]